MLQLVDEIGHPLLQLLVDERLGRLHRHEVGGGLQHAIADRHLSLHARHQIESLPNVVAVEQYLEATGRETEEFIAELRDGAARAVLADLALRAVVVQEAIEASDADVDAEVARLAERAKEKPERLRRDLERRGVLEAVRSEIARGKALEFLVEHASIVNEAGDAIDLTLPEHQNRNRPTTRPTSRRVRKRELAPEPVHALRHRGHASRP